MWHALLCLQQGVADVKQHRWFRGVDWDAVLQRKLVVSSYDCTICPAAWLPVTALLSQELFQRLSMLETRGTLNSILKMAGSMYLPSRTRIFYLSKTFSINFAPLYLSVCLHLCHTCTSNCPRHFRQFPHLSPPKSPLFRYSLVNVIYFHHEM